MKKNIFAISMIKGIALALIFTACSDSEEVLPEPMPETRTITFTASLDKAKTRMSYEELDGEGGIKVRWTETDVLKLFPVDYSAALGTYTIVPGSIENDGKTATFTGPEIGEDGHYVMIGSSTGSKMPNNDDGYNFKIDYLGQEQAANDDMGHLGCYDFIISGVDISGGTFSNMDFNHEFSSVFEFELTGLPQGTYNEFIMTSNDTEGILHTTSYEGSKLEYTDEFPVQLADIVPDEDGTLTIWVMLPVAYYVSEPTFKAGTLTLAVTDADGITYTNATTIIIPSGGTDYELGQRYYMTMAMQAPVANVRQEFLDWYNGGMTTDFTLSSNIDLTGVTLTPGVLPGGKVFDGGGHTITGLEINGNYSLGLFDMNSGTIKNVIVQGATITSTGTEVGVIAGYNDGIIIGCQTINCSVEGNDYIGGIVGLNAGTIVACYESGSTISGGSGVGGVVGGQSSGSITACYAAPNEVSNVNNTKGAVVGSFNGGAIISCYWQHSTLNGMHNILGSTIKSDYADCWEALDDALDDTPAEGVVSWGENGLVYLTTP
ncbi:fimbrillin family protein [Bacteroides sp. 51]|uniref:fimbrillin family protein n=1 Tax=Bacteroides sp. 51 TaxID=2302938 RepID=UPI0013D44FA6|nr:fimbrillin family protein [Bacteroides sp. 51]NDV84242.1 hypothetical protein [Bacteroides sp. 51]